MCMGGDINIPAISKPTARRPIELEGAVRVGDEGSVQLQSLIRGLRSREVNKAVTGVGSMQWLVI